MAIELKHPVKQEFVLTKLDPTGEAKVTFRQANAVDNQVRDTLLFASQERVLDEDSVRVTNTVPFSVRQEIEVRLTIASCEGILRPNGSPLFRFRGKKLDMTPDQFHAAWALITDSRLSATLWGHCLDVNPDWDWRAGSDGENPPVAEETESE